MNSHPNPYFQVVRAASTRPDRVSGPIFPCEFARGETVRFVDDNESVEAFSFLRKVFCRICETVEQPLDNDALPYAEPLYHGDSSRGFCPLVEAERCGPGECKSLAFAMS